MGQEIAEDLGFPHRTQGEPAGFPRRNLGGGHFAGEGGAFVDQLQQASVDDIQARAHGLEGACGRLGV